MLLRCIAGLLLLGILSSEAQILYENKVQENCQIEGQSFSPNEASCIPCPNHCKRCNPQQSCILCEDGYVLNLDGQCSESCPRGNYLYGTTQSCFSCDVKFCIECEEEASCTRCEIGFILSGNRKECILNACKEYERFDREAGICSLDCYLTSDSDRRTCFQMAKQTESMNTYSDVDERIRRQNIKAVFPYPHQNQVCQPFFNSSSRQFMK